MYQEQPAQYQKECSTSHYFAIYLVFCRKHKGRIQDKKISGTDIPDM